MEPLTRPDISRVSCIDVRVGKGNIYIKQGRRLALECDSVPELSALRCGVWHIRINDGNRAAVYIPPETELSAVRIALGTGTLNIGSLCALDIDIKTGGGTVIADRISAETIHIEIGSGICRSGISPRRSAFLECGMGDMTIDLTCPPSRYKIRTERGIGSIKVYGHDTARNSVTGSGECEIFVRCGMGKIELDTV